MFFNNFFFFFFCGHKNNDVFQRFKYGSNEGLWCFFETCHIVGRWWGWVSYIPGKVNKIMSIINGNGSNNKEVFLSHPCFSHYWNLSSGLMLLNACLDFRYESRPPVNGVRGCHYSWRSKKREIRKKCYLCVFIVYTRYSHT